MPTVSSPPSDPNRTARLRAQRQRDRTVILAVSSFAVLCVVLVIIVAVSLGSRRDRTVTAATDTADADTVMYMGYAVPIYPELPINELDSEAFSTKNDLLTYDDGSIISQNGIDVSEHQGEIDWEKVSEAGITFAFLRIGYRGYTEGMLYPDARFEENYAAAKACGLSVGVYFYSQAVTSSEAKHEAEYVLELLDGRTLDLPVVVDWEYADADSARTDEISGMLLTSISDTFCSLIENSSYSAAIYFNKDTGYIQYDLGSLSDYAFWIADYNSTPVFYYAHEYWQYSDNGTVDGITEPVDLNLRFVEKVIS
ncbi:MAG: glycoside hydrolase family 25 protein [Clostridiaceae bacterium]|nr:glycoside hydrolase family 25 protein [Clostridiaceae bacterium]